ncbi:hypothetical protein PG989_000960 [Apiospora arundinis]
MDAAYTPSDTMNAQRRPYRSAALPVMDGKMPEAMRYEVTVKLMFWTENPQVLRQKRYVREIYEAAGCGEPAREGGNGYNPLLLRLGEGGIGYGQTLMRGGHTSFYLRVAGLCCLACIVRCIFMNCLFLTLAKSIISDSHHGLW